MKEVNYTATRLIPTTPEEKAVVKSWGSDWASMLEEEKKEEGILILFGDWSGYKAGQYRITHITRAPAGVKTSGQIGVVNFTDGTTMTVWVERLRRKTILERNLRKKDSYSDLINKLIKSGMSYYDVP